jgi:quercetin dioxygenase-like cupin family protein
MGDWTLPANQGMNMHLPAIVAEQDRPAPLDVGGFLISVLASSAQTGGNEFFHQSGPQGKGPGPHFHPWDETFFVLKGHLHCGVDGVDTIAQPGTMIHVPGGSTHWFQFGEGGCEILAITSRGNASAMFTDFAKRINWDNPDRSHLIALAAQHGQTIITAA